MNSIYMVITNAGDGSNEIEWHRTWSDEKLEKLEETHDYNRYASGDGIQMTEFYFTNQGYDEFVQHNGITFFEDENLDNK